MSDPFDDEQLRAAYAPVLRDSSSAHGPTCPSPDALLAAARGEGAERERLQLLDHALRCVACRRELALLHSVSGGGTAVRAETARRSSWRRLVPMAAAAAIVLAVGLVSVDTWRAGAKDDVTRAGAGASGEIALISPSGESVSAGRPVTFAWHPVAGAIHYTLEVDATDGTVLFTARVADTVRTVDSLSAGEHRWSVRAQMDDGSEHRSISRILRLR